MSDWQHGARLEISHQRRARDAHRGRRRPKGTHFEFGVGPTWMAPADGPLEGNFVHLKKLCSQGVFLDGNTHAGDPEVRQERITAMNINELWRKHAIPNDLDMMSIDVDGQKFWTWMALDYSPKVMISEYNGAMDIDESVVMPV